MRRVNIFILVLVLEVEFSHCLLKNVGELTNFSLFLDSELTKLAVRGTKLKKSSLLVGGIEINPKDVPHNVIFLNFEGICEGSILSSKIVLTAAHCLDANKNLLEMRIFAGSRYFLDHTADVHKIWDFIIHHNYNYPSMFSNDAALLIIKDKFNFKQTVNKALLINHNNWLIEGNTIKVIGWGDSENGSEKVLQSVNMHPIPLTECQSKGGTHLAPDMFCLVNDAGHGSCRNDAGSGSLWNNMIVGIASHGGSCGEYAEVHTNVYYLRPWIELASQKLYYKFCLFHRRDHGDY